MTYAEKIISFNKQLKFAAPLPERIRVMNPFVENEYALEISSAFYRKYYADNLKRKMILGINPGRHGAGVTGIPFTDTKRLDQKCGISFSESSTHEPSSVFIYEMIDAFGGTETFYKQFYFTSLSPLGFVITNNNGKEVNYNYYDSPELLKATRPFIESTLRTQIDFGFDTEVCYCLGTGKNFKFFDKLNRELQLFGRIIPLEHPRFVMQYRQKRKDEFIQKYIRLLKHPQG